MTDFTRTFTATRVRTAQEAIVEVAGWTGFWPFRRNLSFHIGVNCDAIAVQDGQLHVRRRGRTIAVAARSGRE